MKTLGKQISNEDIRRVIRTRVLQDQRVENLLVLIRSINVDRFGE